MVTHFTPPLLQQASHMCDNHIKEFLYVTLLSIKLKMQGTLHHALSFRLISFSMSLSFQYILFLFRALPNKLLVDA